MVGEHPELIIDVKWNGQTSSINWHLGKPTPMTVVVLRQHRKYPLAQRSLTMYCHYDAGIFGKKAHEVKFDDLTATCLKKA